MLIRAGSKQPALPLLAPSLSQVSVSLTAFPVFSTVMQKAWRERNPQARIKAAYQALELNNE